MNPLRQAKIEELEALKQQLLQEQVGTSLSTEDLASFYGEAPASNTFLDSESFENSAKTMSKALNGVSAKMYSDVPRNGFIDACVLAGLTLLFQVFFLFISYLIFH